jgi:hypothetical protein
VGALPYPPTKTEPSVPLRAGEERQPLLATEMGIVLDGPAAVRSGATATHALLTNLSDRVIRVRSTRDVAPDGNDGNG